MKFDSFLIIFWYHRLIYSCIILLNRRQKTCRWIFAILLRSACNRYAWSSTIVGGREWRIEFMACKWRSRCGTGIFKEIICNFCVSNNLHLLCCVCESLGWSWWVVTVGRLYAWCPALVCMMPLCAWCPALVCMMPRMRCGRVLTTMARKRVSLYLYPYTCIPTSVSL